MSLAVRRGAGQDGGAPVGMHLDLGVLPRRAGFVAAAGDLDVGGHADTHGGPVPALAPGGLLGPQPGVVGGLNGTVQGPLVVAGVVQRALAVRDVGR